MTLTGFLTARLDEDEVVAQAAAEDRDDSWISAEKILDCGMDAEAGEQVARWSPGRVLREVEAKRATVARVARLEHVIESMEEDDDDARWSLYRAQDELRRALAHLAAVYADHPDYRQEWRP